METGRVKFVVEKRKDGRHYLRVIGQWPDDMDKKEALLYAIQKFEAVERAHREEEISQPILIGGQNTCALCHLYYNWEKGCGGCPVTEDHSDQRGCSFTTIETYIWARSSGHNHDHYARLAHNVVEFGYSLLREMEKSK
jgi:hypothetical protein